MPKVDLLILQFLRNDINEAVALKNINKSINKSINHDINKAVDLENIKKLLDILLEIELVSNLVCLCPAMVLITFILSVPIIFLGIRSNLKASVLLFETFRQFYEEPCLKKPILLFFTKNFDVKKHFHVTKEWYEINKIKRDRLKLMRA